MRSVSKATAIEMRGSLRLGSAQASPADPAFISLVCRRGNPLRSGIDKLNVDTLTPLGLMINEVATNAMKYAFPEKDGGTFTIKLSRADDEKLRLLVGDNGVGMPVDLSDGDSDSLGTTLMESLSEQLNGELKRLDMPGTMYEMIFEEIHK